MSNVSLKTFYCKAEQTVVEKQNPIKKTFWQNACPNEQG